MSIWDRAGLALINRAGDVYTVSGSATTFKGIMDTEDVMDTDQDGNITPVRHTVVRCLTSDATALPRFSVIQRSGLSYKVNDKEVESDGSFTKLIVERK